MDKELQKLAFKSTLSRLKSYLIYIKDYAGCSLKKEKNWDSIDESTAIEAIVFIKTQRTKLATLAYVVRVVCGQSELELITANEQVTFYGFLDKCESVVEDLKKKLKRTWIK